MLFVYRFSSKEKNKKVNWPIYISSPGLLILMVKYLLFSGEISVKVTVCDSHQWSVRSCGLSLGTLRIPEDDHHQDRNHQSGHLCTNNRISSEFLVTRLDL